MDRANAKYLQSFGGSFQGLLEEFKRRHNGEGTALQLVQMVTDTFPSFRDETWLDGRRGDSLLSTVSYSIPNTQ